ncbi:MAG: L,D-transpeptidase [Gammaproteobacteria bacterium]|nr:L,D-transpeptidase [Gammaproteobacteria bacterium]
MFNINKKTNEKVIDINIKKQELSLLQGETLIASYAISTAKNGVGQQNGSECTPSGWHSIRAKIGLDAEVNTVFVGRRNSGEIFSEELQASNPERDWILTRIIWLSGLEPGKNRGGEVDTMRRYIYIHGCPDSDSFSKPSSHGCVKMRNKDIIELFDNVEAGTRVLIHTSK